MRKAAAIRSGVAVAPAALFLAMFFAVPIGVLLASSLTVADMPGVTFAQC